MPNHAKPDAEAEHVAAALRARILNREFDGSLPPIANLARDFHTSESTVRRAERLLADARLVVLSNGRRPRTTPGPRDALWHIQQELTRTIKDLDALRDHVGSLAALIGPYVNYGDDATRLPGDDDGGPPQNWRQQGAADNGHRPWARAMDAGL